MSTSLDEGVLPACVQELLACVCGCVRVCVCVCVCHGASVNVFDNPLSVPFSKRSQRHPISTSLPMFTETRLQSSNHGPTASVSTVFPRRYPSPNILPWRPCSAVWCSPSAPRNTPGSTSAAHPCPKAATMHDA